MADDGSVASVARARIANCNWQMFKLSRFCSPFSIPNHLSALQHIPSIPKFRWIPTRFPLRVEGCCTETGHDGTGVSNAGCASKFGRRKVISILWKSLRWDNFRQLLWDDIHWYPSNYRTCAKYRNYASLKHWPDHVEWKASNCQGVSLWIVLESVWSGRGGLGRGQSCEGAEMERSSLAECRNCPCLYCNLVTSKASSRA